MDDFYLTLPSNVVGEGNLTNCYRTRLPEIITLVGYWDVALVEIQYPLTWYNMDKELEKDHWIRNNQFEVYFKDGGYIKLNINVGHYMTVMDVLDAMNKSIKKYAAKEHIKWFNAQKEKDPYTPLDSFEVAAEKLHKNRKKRSPENDEEDKSPEKTNEEEKKPRERWELVEGLKFKYDHGVKRVYAITDRRLLHFAILSRKLKYMLGYHADDTLNQRKAVARFPPDMRGGVDSLYVYCDLIENQLVGDCRTNLLRIVPVRGQYNDIVNEIFTAPHYVPVLKKQFETVEISIKTDQDRLVPFQFGKSIVKLHFRRRS